MMSREESLAAFVSQVQEIFAIWPEGGTMYVSPRETQLTAHPVQKPGWPCLRLATKQLVEQPETQPERPASEQVQQGHLF